jgi:putative flippase GtrA
MVSYSFYLVATHLGLSSFKAISILYPLGILLSYIIHRKVTFKIKEKNIHLREIIYFVLVYLSGLLFNFLLIHFLCIIYNFPHQLVQFISIFLVAFYIFILSKRITFNTSEKNFYRQ